MIAWNEIATEVINFWIFKVLKFRSLSLASKMGGTWLILRWNRCVERVLREKLKSPRKNLSPWIARGKKLQHPRGRVGALYIILLNYTLKLNIKNGLIKVHIPSIDYMRYLSFQIIMCLYARNSFVAVCTSFCEPVGAKLGLWEKFRGREQNDHFRPFSDQNLAFFSVPLISLKQEPCHRPSFVH